jgi:hypothetical protein
VKIEAIAAARSWIVILALAALADIGCASAARAPAGLGPTFEQKMASILRVVFARLRRLPPRAVPAGRRSNRR